VWKTPKKNPKYSIINPNISKLLKIVDNKMSVVAIPKFKKHNNKLALKFVNPE
jgi:hypothetical protein